jgi:hypothetical protein
VEITGTGGDFWSDYRAAYANSLADNEKQNLEQFNNVFLMMRSVRQRFPTRPTGMLFIMLRRDYPVTAPYQLLNLLPISMIAGHLALSSHEYGAPHDWQKNRYRWQQRKRPQIGMTSTTFSKSGGTDHFPRERRNLPSLPDAVKTNWDLCTNEISDK